MGKFLNIVLAGLLIFVVTGCQEKPEQNKTDQAVSTECDRQCLEGFVNQYLAAMIAHDPSRAPFAENARYTENAEEMPLANISKGLWTKATGLDDYRFYVSDTQAGQVAFVGLIRTKVQEEMDGKIVQAEKPVLLSMRLKLENQRITEAEAIIVDTMMGGGMGGRAMTVPPAAYSETLALEDRVSREELVKISNLYFDSIEQCNGKIVPWHDECYRLENGMWTAGPELPPELAVHMKEPQAPTPAPGEEASPAFARGPCTEAIDSGVFALIESIRPRRIPVVDEERGVTWGVYMFNHPGVETITMPDGTTQPAAYFRGQPNSMPMSELFKIKGGEIRDIMAIGIVKEYGSDSGWE